MYDATIDGVDNQQSEDQQNRDPHPDAIPTRSARVFGIDRGFFQKLESATQISCNPLGATLSSRNRDAVDSDGYDGTRADAEGTAAD